MNLHKMAEDPCFDPALYVKVSDYNEALRTINWLKTEVVRYQQQLETLSAEVKRLEEEARVLWEYYKQDKNKQHSIDNGLDNYVIWANLKDQADVAVRSLRERSKP